MEKIVRITYANKTNFDILPIFKFWIYKKAPKDSIKFKKLINTEYEKETNSNDW